MITYKIKYKRYIVNLYVPEQKSGRVVLLLPGLPMSTDVNNILKPFLDAGAIIFYPYFSGSYDSGGSFGAAQSIRDVAKLYPLTQMSVVTELYFGKQIELGVPSEVILVGMSYGAGIALLGHQNLYQKIILFSPALLFNPIDIGGEIGRNFHEQMKNLFHLLRKAHPFTYRLGFSSDLEKFLMGNNNHVHRQSIIEALNKISFPLLVLHGKNDVSVPVEIIHSLEGKTLNKNISWRYIESAHSTSSYGDEGLELVQKFIEE